MRHRFVAAACWATLVSFSMAQEASELSMPPDSSNAGLTQAPVAVSTSEVERQQVILVVGSPGTEEYQKNFATWAARWEDAAKRAEAGFTAIGFSQEAQSAEQQLTTATDFQALLDAIETAGKETTTEPLWIVFIGHGTFDGRTASWNLRGPDLSSEQLSTACQNVSRPLALVACCSCASPFINTMSGANRVIVSATKDGNQIQYSRFGDAMSMAISTLEGDINRDGQTSLLEAWLFASRRTAEFYKTEGRLASEHSLLEDSGDAKGVRSELFEGDQVAPSVKDPDEIDGELAARWHLVRSDEERRLSPEQRRTRDDLEAEIKALRKQKDRLNEDEYLQRLETLLVPLAKLYESVEEQPHNDPK